MWKQSLGMFLKTLKPCPYNWRSCRDIIYVSSNTFLTICYTCLIVIFLDFLDILIMFILSQSVSYCKSEAWNISDSFLCRTSTHQVSSSYIYMLFLYSSSHIFCKLRSQGSSVEEPKLSYSSSVLWIKHKFLFFA